MRGAPFRAAVYAAVPLTFGAIPSVARGAEPQHPGKKPYQQYCSACHGWDAKGDGIVGTFMRLKPPDLTQLSSRSGGEFPLEQVVKTIDGREMLRAHGEPAMPVWGQVLSDGSGDKRRVPVERRVQGRILAIAEYLRTIQAK